ncbi:hypothetical protein MKY29_07710 [Psychrobacillus sp. FSL K6-2365]|uniref:hypothetical protein n=1 Tax=Psychrobacillus sp. FSL K6-2365 TaxID=2921546 RepID=UPI0030F958A0
MGLPGGADDYKTIEHGGEWADVNYDDYYLYFTHPNVEYRKYSLLIFMSALAHWHSKAANVFVPIKIRKKDYYPAKVYNFEDYVRSFLDNQEAIKREFPLFNEIILIYLIGLSDRNNFENVFREFDKQILVELREVLHKNKELKDKTYNTNDIVSILEY